MGYSPRGRKESDTTELLHFHFSLSLSLSFFKICKIIQSNSLNYFGACTIIQRQNIYNSNNTKVGRKEINAMNFLYLTGG